MVYSEVNIGWKSRRIYMSLETRYVAIVKWLKYRVCLSWVVGRGWKSWVWVWVNVVGIKKYKKNLITPFSTPVRLKKYVTSLDFGLGSRVIYLRHIKAWPA